MVINILCNGVGNFQFLNSGGLIEAKKEEKVQRRLETEGILEQLPL